MKENLLSLVENSRAYTLAVTESMPAKLDDFKPAPDVWNFREQLHHIAYGIEWWKDNYIEGIKTAWDPPIVSKSRKEVVTYLCNAYDALRESISKDSVSEEQYRGIFATLDHVTHHRGQVILYLRCNGITAPEYSY